MTQSGGRGVLGAKRLVATVALLLVALVLLSWVLLDRMAGVRLVDGPGGEATDQVSPGAATSSAPPLTDPTAGSGPGVATANIMDHGATGDGLTSDQEAWEAALDAVAPGGTLVLPSGRSFALPGAVSITKPVRIEGHGATIVKTAGSPRLGNWFVVGADDVVVEGITFLDPDNRVSANLMTVQNGLSGSRILGNTFVARDGVALRLDGVVESVVEGNVIDGARGAIFLTGPAREVTIQDNQITNWRNYGIYTYGTMAGAPSGLKITGNTITDMAPGGYPRYPIHTAKSGSTSRLREVTVSDNVVIGPDRSYTVGKAGTADQISLQQIDGLLVEGNISRDGGDMGITVESCTDAIVRDNVATGADVAGIAIFTDVMDATVTGNTTLNNGQNRGGDRALPGRAGIRLATSTAAGPVGVSITDNLTGDRQSTKTQQYGISIRASQDVVAGPNVDEGNAISMYLDETGNTGLSLVQAAAP